MKNSENRSFKNRFKYSFLRHAFMSAGILAATGFGLPAQDSDEESFLEDVFELSPFVVETSESTYSATSTLSGTRIRTDVSDVGSSISILTEQLMDDVVATDAGSLLTFVPNVEVGGELGNFSGATTVQDTYQIDGDRRSSTANNRVRGLDSAQRTRNYFATFVPFDSYNTSRMTVNRGPNSVLFGLGNAGGVMESSIARPLLEEANKFQFSLNQYGGHREVMDVNRVFLGDRLKVRAIFLNEDKQYRQKEAFNKQQRAFLTWDYKLRDADDDALVGDTKVRGYFERGEMDRNPPDIIPPSIYYQYWHNLDYLNEIIGKYPGINSKSDLMTAYGNNTWAASIADGGTWRANAIIDNTDTSTYSSSRILTAAYNVAIVYDQPNSSHRDVHGYDGFHARARFGGPRGRQDHKCSWGGSFAGFNAPTVMNRGVFDFVNHLYSGNTDQIEEDFDVQEFALEQEFLGGKSGLEIAYNKQERDGFEYTPYSGGRGKRIVLDVSEYVTIPAGSIPTALGDLEPDMALNPNVGRPMIGFRDGFTAANSELTYESFRATAFAAHDFRDTFESWVGRFIGQHTVSGLYQDYSERSRSENSRLVYESDTYNLQNIHGTYRSGERQVRSLVYVGPSAIGTSSIEEVKLDFPLSRSVVPQAGESVRIAYWDRGEKQFNAYDGYTAWADWGGGTSKKIAESSAFIVQSDWLDDHLTTLFAWRNDEQSKYERDTALSNTRDPDGSIPFSNIVLLPEPVSVVSGDTFTQSYVLKFPEKYLFELPWDADFRVSYFESESFNPGNINRTLRGVIIPDPNSNTEEFGVAVDLFNRRLSVRVNWFETSSNDKRNGGGLNSMSNWAGHGGGWLERVAEFEKLGQPVSAIPGNAGQIVSYDQLYDILLNITPAYFRDNITVDFDREAADVDGVGIQGLSSTEAFVAKGVELEVVGSITDNWNIMFNVSKQETVSSNIQPGVIDFVNTVTENLKAAGLWDMYDAPAAGGITTTYGQRWTWDAIEPALNQLAKEGQISPEQRKWRWNLVSSYRFSDGALKGLRVGGLMRWQDKSAIGYPKLMQNGNLVNDIANPYYGETEFNADAWISYERKIFKGIDWRVQLNIRNLAGGDSGNFIPVSRDAIGRVQAIRIGPERQVILTNTFKF